MKKEELWRELRELIARNNLLKAFELAKISISDQETLDVILGFQSMFSRIETEGYLAIRTSEQLDIDRNKVVTGFLKLITNIENQKINLAPHIMYNILCLCDTAQEREHLAEFKMRANLLNVEVRLAKHVAEPSQISSLLQEFDLIVLDNRFWGEASNPVQLSDRSRYRSDPQKLDRVRARLKLLDMLIKSRKAKEGGAKKIPLPPYFLHLGASFYMVRDWPEYFHAANSFFSLHQRIIEVLEYIRAMRKPHSAIK